MHALLLLTLLGATFAILWDIHCAKDDIIKAIGERVDPDKEKIKKVIEIVEANKAKMQKAVDDNQ